MKQRNRFQEQRLAKQQFQNRFYRQLEEICTLAAGKRVYMLLPPKDRLVIFLNRVLPMRVLAQEGDSIPEKILAAMRTYLPQMMNETSAALYPNGPEVSLTCAHSVGLSLSLYVKNLKAEEYPEAAAVKTALQKLVYDDFFILQVLGKVNEIMEVLSTEMSSYSGGLYWLTHKRADFLPGKAGLQYLLYIHRYAVEQKNFLVDGKSRPAVRVVWIVPDEGVCTAEVSAEVLGKPQEAERYPVYIQFHALHRLRERLDCHSIPATHVNIYLSMTKPNVRPLDERTYLIEYSIFGHKIGYFRAVVVKHAILLQTFLLVTQNGTPEGKKLQEIAGVTKQDKTFLALDRLSSFMTPEFAATPALQSLFEEAGCTKLLEAYTFLQQLVQKNAQPTAAQTMVHYLGLDAQPEFTETLFLEHAQPTEAEHEPRR
jgi:hypothetical protein